MKMIEIDRLRFFGPGLFTMMVIFSCCGQNGRKKTLQAADVNISQDASKEAFISFDTLSHDFGTIIEGEKVVCYFNYANSGGDDLVINSVKTTCGCTIPEWKREPLRPGEKESLKVVFDAAGRSGSQLKVITVRSNAGNSTIRLTITAFVNKVNS